MNAAEEFFARDWDSAGDRDILEEYGCTEEEKTIYRRLSAELLPARLRHSLGVMALSVTLASLWDASLTRKARLAGLLHDCAKSRAGALEHGPVGADVARNEYGVTDEEILSAIRFHTTGRAGMSLLEKIIYVSDYAEPFRRPLPGLDDVRSSAFEDPDRAVFLCASATLAYLRSKEGKIDPATQETAAYYQNGGEKTPELREER